MKIYGVCIKVQIYLRFQISISYFRQLLDVIATQKEGRDVESPANKFVANKKKTTEALHQKAYVLDDSHVAVFEKLKVILTISPML